MTPVTTLPWCKQAPIRYNAAMKRDEQLYTLDEGEEILHQTQHHPIGIVSQVVGIGLVGLLGLAGLIASGPITSALALGIPQFVLALIILLIVGVAGLMTFISIKVYFKSYLIITNQTIIEINQFSLFNRDVSQLSLANVQEVTVQQSGLFARVFDYGSVTLETAGEKANFGFDKTPNPHYVSRVIYDGHERFIETHPEFTDSR
ncbi:hypothetical protein BRC20_01295 [Candidatus Saccharibacteria bacterium QS_8_54_8]|nr:MAG: hypothetical protein BRC20_01295 [Candidatus Saccharibacteria bacterium QS_8_54_8]